MQGFVKIENADGLVRDLSSGAVINTNRVEYENYLQKRKSSSELKQQIKQNSDEIKEIKSEISEIKQLLISLINKEN
jgi:wobble nucleotide-excising tRNase